MAVTQLDPGLSDEAWVDNYNRQSSVMGTLRNLASIRRYSRDHCIAPEDVLRHVGFSVMYAYYLGEAVREADRLPVQLDLLLSRAALHDAEEAEVGDIPRPAKYYSPASLAAFEEMSRGAAEQLLGAFGPQAFACWEKAKDASTEGRTMRVVDLASVVEMCQNEVLNLGNRGFLRVAAEVVGYIKELQSRAKEENWPSRLRLELELLCVRTRNTIERA